MKRLHSAQSALQGFFLFENFWAESQAYTRALSDTSGYDFFPKFAMDFFL